MLSMADAQIERDAMLARALQDAEEASENGEDASSSQPLLKRLRRAIDADEEVRRRKAGPLPGSAAATSVLLHSPAGLREGLCIESHGTLEEPVFVVRNVDGQRGALFEQLALVDLCAAGMERPEPKRRGEKYGVIVERFHKRRTKQPWRTGLRMEDLHATAHSLLRELRELHPDVPLLKPRDRGWNDTELLVYNQGGAKVGPHEDAQPKGSLLFIFCAGLASRSVAWPGGREVQLLLESGDVMVIEGKTCHAVPESGIAGTSPFPAGTWLGRRRLAILIRQQPPA